LVLLKPQTGLHRPSYPLRLEVALPLQGLTVLDLGLDEVLLGSGQEEALGVHGPDDVVPDGAALAVVPAHPSRQVLLYHLRTIFKFVSSERNIHYT